MVLWAWKLPHMQRKLFLPQAFSSLTDFLSLAGPRGSLPRGLQASIPYKTQKGERKAEGHQAKSQPAAAALADTLAFQGSVKIHFPFLSSQTLDYFKIFI